MSTSIHCLILLCSCLLALQAAEPTKIILDTDIGGDVDDAGAVAVAHHLADTGDAELLGIISSRSTDTWYAVGAIDAINTWYGRPSLPIGVNKVTVRNSQERYTDSVAKNRSWYGHNLLDADDAPDQVTVYKNLLTAQSDNSVVIVTVGQLDGVYALMKDAAGLDLFTRKVKRLVVMGGNKVHGLADQDWFDITGDLNPNHDDSNLEKGSAGPHAKYVVENLPSGIELFLSPFGRGIHSGGSLDIASDKNPVRECYANYKDAKGLKSNPGYELDYWKSYDQIAVYFAVLGNRDGLFSLRDATLAWDSNYQMSVTFGSGRPHRVLIVEDFPGTERVIDGMIGAVPLAQRHAQGLEGMEVEVDYTDSRGWKMGNIILRNFGTETVQKVTIETDNPDAGFDLITTPDDGVSVSPALGGDNDGIESSVVTISLVPGLAPGMVLKLPMDIDGPDTGFTATVRTSGGTLSGTLVDVGDSDDGDPRRFLFNTAGSNPTPDPDEDPDADASDPVGLIAAYDFDEGAGDTAHDDSGYGDALTLSLLGDATWVAGGIHFAGNGRLQANNAGKISQQIIATNRLTIEAWIEPDVLDQEGPARLVSLSAGGSDRNVTLGHGYWQEAHNGLEVRLRTSSSDSNGRPAVQVDNALDTGLQQVAVTYDGSDVRVYRNGALIATEPRNASLQTWDPSFALAMGGEVGGIRGWTGTLHAVRIYDRDLSASEIQQSHAAGVTAADPESGLMTDIQVNSGRTVEKGELVVGAAMYSDRDAVYEAVPASVLGQEYLLTPNDDKTNGSDDYLTFTLQEDAMVYVGYDDRLTAPDWLSTWTLTGEKLNDGQDSWVRRLYRKWYPAGTVVLGGNMQTSQSSNYTVIAIAGAAPADPGLPPSLSAGSITLRGDIQSNVSGAVSVTVNGQSATVSGETWQADVPATEGTNIYQVIATDAAGQQSLQEIIVDWNPSVGLAGG